MLAAFLGIVAAILTIPLGMPAFIFGMASGVDWRALLTRPGFLISAVAMMLMTGIRAQISFESVTVVGARGTAPQAAPVNGDLEQDRRHSKAAYAAQVTLIGTYLALTYGLNIFGHRGFYVFPALFAALLVFYDARPDIGQRLFPELWRERKVERKSVKKFAKRGKRRSAR